MGSPFGDIRDERWTTSSGENVFRFDAVVPVSSGTMSRMSAAFASRRSTLAVAALASLLVVLSGVLVVSPVHAGGAMKFDAALTRKLDSKRLETTSPAARCLEARVAELLRSGRKATSARLQRSCRLKVVTVVSVHGRGKASQVAAAVMDKPVMAAALTESGHLSVTVRGIRPAKRKVVVAVATTVTPRVNDAPEAYLWTDVTYGVLDEDPVQVMLHEDARDSDGQVVSRVWSVTAPDGSPVPVQQLTDSATFTAVGTGVHTVTLTVTDNDGATDSESETVDPIDPMTSEKKSALEQSILENTNAQRALYGLEAVNQAPLAWHPCLGANARAHTVNMARAGGLYHQQYTDTTTACPENYPGWGENVLWRMDQFNGPALVKQWMDSPGHRANILSAFTHMGVGVHYDRANGRMYAAQVFYRLTTP
jgi:uncharacterized protein YkwD